MKSLKSTLVRNALVGLIAGGSMLAAAAYATSGSDIQERSRCATGHGQGFHAHIEERARHMAELKEKLQLSPAQEQAWGKLIESARPGQQQRDMDRQARRDEFQKLNTIERLEKIQTMKEMRQARMGERIESLKTFYAQLTPEQQKVFDAELRSHRQERMQHRRFES